MALAFAVLLCAASGFALIRLGWRGWSTLADLLLQLSLAVGFGLGIFSLIFFVALLAHLAQLLLLDAIVCALLFATVLLLRRKQVKKAPAGPEQTPAQFPDWFCHFLTAAFVIALAGALYSAIMRFRAYPLGDGWDAFAIWNLHARFLFRGGEHWRDGFSTLLPWSHPDYPLLLPAAIAHFWKLADTESPLVPALLALVFTLATAGVLFSALVILRGRRSAMLAAITLLATPAFIECGASQYADVPISFFILATIVFLHLHEASGKNPSQSSGFLALAGLAAAFAAWTKNEGLLFFGVALLVQFLNRTPADGPNAVEPESRIREWSAATKRTAFMLLTAAPVLLTLACFKYSVAHSDEVFSDSASTVHKLLTPARCWIILQWYVKEFLRFGHWLLVPLTLAMVALFFMAGRDRLSTHSPGFRASLLTLGLTFFGYAGIYLIASYDIHWHLRFSLNRLFLQYWPSAIFLFFLSLRYSGYTTTTPITTPHIVSK